MSDRPMPPIPKGLDLTPEQIAAISGAGDCSASEMNTITSQIRQSYDDLVDFTSYVFERISNSL